MNRTSKVAYFIALGALICVALVAMYYRTALGFYELKFAHWEEERYVGQPVSRLEANLKDRGRTLERASPDGLYATSQRVLLPNQKLYRFLKGFPYRSRLVVGSVQNVGYVITDTSELPEKIVEIVKAKYVDAL